MHLICWIYYSVTWGERKKRNIVRKELIWRAVGPEIKFMFLTNRILKQSKLCVCTIGQPDLTCFKQHIDICRICGWVLKATLLLPLAPTHSYFCGESNFHHLPHLLDISQELICSKRSYINLHLPISPGKDWLWVTFSSASSRDDKHWQRQLKPRNIAWV